LYNKSKKKERERYIYGLQRFKIREKLREMDRKAQRQKIGRKIENCSLFSFGDSCNENKRKR